MVEREKNYYLHRISHESELAYPLFYSGYLSMGFSEARNIGIEDKCGEYLAKRKEYEKIYPQYGRGYNGLWRFCHMQKAI